MASNSGLRFALVLGMWTLVGLVSLVSGILQHRLEGLAVPWTRVGSDVLGWYLWAALLPVAWWATRRFPLERGRFPLHLAIHIAVGLLVAAVYAVLATIKAHVILSLVSGAWTGGDAWTSSFFATLRSYLFGGLPLYLVVYFLLVAGTHAVEYYRRFRERELRATELEARLAQARLQVLQMQLDPHFLFNALNGVSAQLHADPLGAERMLEQLSEFLRATLREAGRQEVPLTEELSLLDAYLGVERARFGDRLQVAYEIEPGARDSLVPSLLLQPLVENAIRHGMRGAGLTIRVRAAVVGGDLELAVEDDGRGLAGGPLREGVGLGNTRARLRALHNERQSLAIEPRPEGGMVVRLRLPRRDARSGAGREGWLPEVLEEPDDSDPDRRRRTPGAPAPEAPPA